MPARTAPSLSSSSAVDEGRFLPGAVVAGRYRIAGLLGRGGMGEVYRATDLVLGQAVALKFLPEAASRDERALARFFNEVKTARQVTHPNVCRVYDIGELDGLQYISMEYVDGEDLSVLLRRIGRLPSDKAIEIARKLCAGLAAAHDKGVLHRDLKPANIMIDGRGQVVIMDFGLAGLAENLQTDVRSGTPAYMSPEQLAGTEVTQRSDIYSLGLVLYELFTGRKAFEAASLMELMQLQEKAHPASLTSLVQELDPAVERAVLRCLEPDPRQRPSSALAVSAALPGGDQLAAALAAGETPTPELLAAAGETEGLNPKVALAWLAAAFAGILAAGVLASSLDATNKAGLDTPPDALMIKARAVLAGFGYSAKPVDSGWGFDYNDAYMAWLKTHPTAAAARWRDPSHGVPIIRFWYLESPYPMTAQRHENTVLEFTDPPLEYSGMARVRLDPNGRLLHLDAIPPQREAPAPSLAFDWSALFRAAGLEYAAFHAVDPEWTPLANWDSRAAWEGIDPASQTKLRVEASAWRGKPISFQLVFPWTDPARMRAKSKDQSLSVLIIVYIALAASIVIAWYNGRSGRIDARGAWKLAGFYAVSSFLNNFIASHHVATAEELTTFWMCVSSAGLNASIVALLYLALEPWVRRRWPQVLITWSRFTTKGLSDPLVGRDVLFGCALGALLALLIMAQYAVHGGEPMAVPLSPLLGLRMSVAGGFSALSDAIINPLIFLFLLFFCRVIFRKTWLSGAVYLVVMTALFSAGTSHPVTDIPMSALFGVLYFVVFMRWGMLAAIVAHAVSDFLQSAPFTLDFSMWYAGVGIGVIWLMGALAVYGFRHSLGGRKLLREEFF